MASIAAIAGLNLERHDARITSMDAVPALGEVPAYTLVRGIIEAEIGFELRCPAVDWNCKLLFGGEGGFAGTMRGPGSPSGVGLRRGNVEVYSDTRRRGEARAGFEAVYDGRWAWRRPERVANWAHRSTHVVLPVARAIAETVCGVPARRCYFMGCSGGGRQAAMVAKRYPRDFDGIVFDCPWLNVTGQVLLWIHVVRALAAHPILPARLQRIRDAMLNAFGDEAAGFVRDPLSPARDAEWLAWLRDGDCGLSADKVEVVKAIYNGAPSIGLPGYLPGAEDKLWPQALVGSIDGGPGERLVLLPENFLKYFAVGPEADLATFDPQRDWALIRRFADELDVKPDLAAFAEAGGKMVMIHGFNDVRISPLFTIAFHNGVVAAFGGSEDRVEDFFRLFLVMGAGHCGGGPGPNEYDGLSAIEHWVEEGRPPRELMSVARRPDGSVTATSHTPYFRWSRQKYDHRRSPDARRGEATGATNAI
ncbi:MAG: tannase/feruloyl esterase family alpha/beta hydrolase [Mesorhizobium sp.]|nr:tannase/feruloyl esterase family alpha/beta hydrolase [Mesorhizobium sp.]MCO5164093.1 tannase/feruloyl esterase family alpha/beta hydrolase [Mesorhizobium sp.]